MTILPPGTFTFLFTDIEGSTKLWEQHAEAMGSVLARHDELLHQAIEQHGGLVFKTMGDAFYAIFMVPAAAVAAALQAQRLLHAEHWSKIGPLRVRMAIHTGIAEQRGNDYFGPTLNRVARLLAAGHGGQILLSLATRELVQLTLPPGIALCDLGLHYLKDLALPEQIFQLLAPDLPSDFPPLRTLTNRPTNLPPPPTPLVGREAEVAAVVQLVDQNRLVTLAGPGGTGKTRLSLEAATKLLDEFEGGVFFVALAPISDAALLPSAIAQVLGLKETADQPLLESLKLSLENSPPLLLLLDNFEQVMAAAPLLVDLLATAPRLKLLVTSREVLHLYGEVEFLVPPLALPDLKQALPPEQITQYDALQFFAQRARMFKAGFELTPENAWTIAQICVRLDGLPLAIELAAARIKLLSPQALLSRLNSRLQLLTGGARDLPTRQQTLRGVIDWSYHLLNETEQRLFAWLAVFVGGGSLEAIESVCQAAAGADAQGGPDSLEMVAALVDKSLLRQIQTASGEYRFVMLETLREYALERLDARGETHLLYRQYAAYYQALVEQAEPHLLGGQQQRSWLDQLESEHDNLRAAIQWSLDQGELSYALAIAGALWRFWSVRGYLSEGRRWLVDILARAAVTPAPPCAKALDGLGMLAYVQGDYAQAKSCFEDSLTLWNQVGDRAGRAFALHGLGIVAHQQGNYEAARGALEESLALRQALGDQWGIAHTIYQLGMAVLSTGDADEGRVLLERSAALMKQVGDGEGTRTVLADLGWVAVNQRKYERATHLLQESLGAARQLNDKVGMARTLILLGWSFFHQGDYAQSTTLFEESLNEVRELGDKSGMVSALSGLGWSHLKEERYKEAQVYFEEALNVIRTVQGDRWGLASALNNLGHVALYQHDHEQAFHLFCQSLKVRYELDDMLGIAYCFERLAGIAEVKDPPPTGAIRATHLCAVAAKLRAARGDLMPSQDHAYYDQVLSAARAQLDAPRFATAWAEGETMTLEEAVAYALQTHATDAHQPLTSGPRPDRESGP